MRDEDRSPEALRDCMEASACGGEEARAAKGPVDECWEAEEEYGGLHEAGEVIDGRARARILGSTPMVWACCRTDPLMSGSG